jgi:hypothetical protein
MTDDLNDRLRQVAAAVSNIGDVGIWFSEGVEIFLNQPKDAKKKSLDAALGLSRPGRDHAATLEGNRKSNDAIYDLAMFLGLDVDDSSDRENLGKKLDRYGASAWLNDRSLSAMPADYVGREKEHLYAAYHHRHRDMPTGEKQLGDILGRIQISRFHHQKTGANSKSINTTRNAAMPDYKANISDVHTALQNLHPGVLVHVRSTGAEGAETYFVKYENLGWENSEWHPVDPNFIADVFEIARTAHIAAVAADAATSETTS